MEWDSARLNYDLVTLVLKKDFDEEDKVETNNFSDNLFNQSNLEVFERIEQYLDNHLKHKEFIEKLQNILISRDFFEEIKSEIAEFKQATISTDNFSLEELTELRKNENLTFFSHLFFYVASLPGQLSTYTALRKLIQEVR